MPADVSSWYKSSHVLKVIFEARESNGFAHASPMLELKDYHWPADWIATPKQQRWHGMAPC